MGFDSTESENANIPSIRPRGGQCELRTVHPSVKGDTHRHISVIGFKAISLVYCILTFSNLNHLIFLRLLFFNLPDCWQHQGLEVSGRKQVEDSLQPPHRQQPVDKSRRYVGAAMEWLLDLSYEIKEFSC